MPQALPQRAEVVVVGGGCMGASIAYHLALRGVQDVLLLERHGLSSGPTGRSTAIIRQHYSHGLLVRMATHGLRTYANFEAAVGGPSGFLRTGVVFAVDEPNREALEHNVALGRSEGVETELIEPEELQAIDGRISTDGLAAACFEPEGGRCDPALATATLAAVATRAGARVVEGVAVDGIARDAVETSRGRVAAGAVVVAAGPWSAGLLGALGFELPLISARAEVGRFRVPVGFDSLLPAFADFSESLFYFLPGEPGYVEVGSLDPRHAEQAIDPDECPEGAERSTLAQFASSLARRVPSLAAGHWRGAWSSVYDVTPDWQPAIGAVPGADGVFVAAGFSGHGFKLAPAVGLALAELVCDGTASTFDLAPLDPGRFARGELLSTPYGYSVLG